MPEDRSTAQLKEQIVRLAQDWTSALQTIQGCHQAVMRGVCSGCPAEVACDFGRVVEALALQLRKRCVELCQEENTNITGRDA